MRVLLVSAAQQVELVSHEGWWDQNSGSVILAVAAITAAALAAYVAIHNQRRQLAHDRFLRNRDQTRDTIDSALLIANEVQDTMDNLMAGVQTLEGRRARSEEPPREIEATVEEYQETGITKMHAMRGAQIRLETRLSADDPVATSHMQAFLAFHVLLKTANGGVAGLRQEEVRKKDAAQERKAHLAFSKFKEACRDWFGESAV